MRKPETEGPRSQAGPPRLPARLGPAPRRSPRPPAQRQLGRRARPAAASGRAALANAAAKAARKVRKAAVCALRRNVPAPRREGGPAAQQVQRADRADGAGDHQHALDGRPGFAEGHPPPPARFPESGVSPGLSVHSPTAPLIESPLSTTRIQTTTAFLHPAPAGTAAGWRPCPGQDLAGTCGRAPPEAQPRAHACARLSPPLPPAGTRAPRAPVRAASQAPRQARTPRRNA